VTAFWNGLPSILVLAAMVGTFLSLRRHAPSARSRLWACAWLLILLHFGDRLFGEHGGTAGSLLAWADTGTLELCGIVFAVSLIPTVEKQAHRLGLLLLLIPATAFHSLAVMFGWKMPWTLSGMLAVIFIGAAAFALRAGGGSSWAGRALSATLAGTGVWAIYFQLHGNSGPAINAILTTGFALAGILFWKRYARTTAGVVATAGGFVLWGAVWPVCWALGHFSVNFPVNPEFWNVPKFVVAFGMVLTLVEDKSVIIERARGRERAENQLLLRFSQATSQLLSSKEQGELCDEIVRAVTEASSFRQAAIFLTLEPKSINLASACGFSAAGTARLEERAGKWTEEGIKALCLQGRRAGSSSFHIQEAGSEDEMLLPLASSRGPMLGFLLLSGAKGTLAPGTSEIAQLEMLASDLAVTIENSRLHRRVARSEKLAALGQLVAGVAHELNNPLTGIIGYSELLGEEVEKESAVRRVQKLGNEARRMKRIVDGLLRFARQSNLTARAADLDAALRDVLQLQEYHLRKRRVEVEVHVEPMLPPLGIGDDELKQLLLNILANAMDAVEDAAQRVIRIRATRQHERIVIQFDDSGPGFMDLNRAFDPFYTTKAVGKGTGLGLSICYGIVQECGGEIALANKEPHGASVEVEIPAATDAAQSVVLTA